MAERPAAAPAVTSAGKHRRCEFRRTLCILLVLQQHLKNHYAASSSSSSSAAATTTNTTSGGVARSTSRLRQSRAALPLAHPATAGEVVVTITANFGDLKLKKVGELTLSSQSPARHQHSQNLAATTATTVTTTTEQMSPPMDASGCQTENSSNVSDSSAPNALLVGEFESKDEGTRTGDDASDSVWALDEFYLTSLGNMLTFLSSAYKHPSPPCLPPSPPPQVTDQPATIGPVTQTQAGLVPLRPSQFKSSHYPLNSPDFAPCGVRSENHRNAASSLSQSDITMTALRPSSSSLLTSILKGQSTPPGISAAASPEHEQTRLRLSVASRGSVPQSMGLPHNPRPRPSPPPPTASAKKLPVQKNLPWTNILKVSDPFPHRQVGHVEVSPHPVTAVARGDATSKVDWSSASSPDCQFGTASTTLRTGLAASASTVKPPPIHHASSYTAEQAAIVVRSSLGPAVVKNPHHNLPIKKRGVLQPIVGCQRMKSTRREESAAGTAGTGFALNRSFVAPSKWVDTSAASHHPAKPFTATGPTSSSSCSANQLVTTYYPANLPPPLSRGFECYSKSTPGMASFGPPSECPASANHRGSRDPTPGPKKQEKNFSQRSTGSGTPAQQNPPTGSFIYRHSSWCPPTASSASYQRNLTETIYGLQTVPWSPAFHPVAPPRFDNPHNRMHSYSIPLDPAATAKDYSSSMHNGQVSNRFQRRGYHPSMQYLHPGPHHISLDPLLTHESQPQTASWAIQARPAIDMLPRHRDDLRRHTAVPSSCSPAKRVELTGKHSSIPLGIHEPRVPSRSQTPLLRTEFATPGSKMRSEANCPRRAILERQRNAQRLDSKIRDDGVSVTRASKHLLQFSPVRPMFSDKRKERSIPDEGFAERGERRLMHRGEEDAPDFSALGKIDATRTKSDCYGEVTLATIINPRSFIVPSKTHLSLDCQSKRDVCVTSNFLPPILHPGNKRKYPFSEPGELEIGNSHPISISPTATADAITICKIWRGTTWGDLWDLCCSSLKWR